MKTLENGVVVFEDISELAKSKLPKKTVYILLGTNSEDCRVGVEGDDCAWRCSVINEQDAMDIANYYANKQVMDAAKELLNASEEMLAYIEMKMAHHGCMSVSMIEQALKHDVPMVSEIETSHHLGCAVTTRRVHLDAARNAMRNAKQAERTPNESAR